MAIAQLRGELTGPSIRTALQDLETLFQALPEPLDYVDTLDAQPARVAAILRGEAA